MGVLAQENGQQNIVQGGVAQNQGTEVARVGLTRTGLVTYIQVYTERQLNRVQVKLALDRLLALTRAIPFYIQIAKGQDLTAVASGVIVGFEFRGSPRMVWPSFCYRDVEAYVEKLLQFYTENPAAGPGGAGGGSSVFESAASVMWYDLRPHGESGVVGSVFVRERTYWAQNSVANGTGEEAGMEGASTAAGTNGSEGHHSSNVQNVTIAAS